MIEKLMKSIIYLIIILCISCERSQVLFVLDYSFEAKKNIKNAQLIINKRKLHGLVDVDEGIRQSYSIFFENELDIPEVIQVVWENDLGTKLEKSFKFKAMMPEEWELNKDEIVIVFRRDDSLGLIFRYIKEVEGIKKIIDVEK